MKTSIYDRVHYEVVMRTRKRQEETLNWFLLPGEPISELAAAARCAAKSMGCTVVSIKRKDRPWEEK